jgi:hypothetical protein
MPPHPSRHFPSRQATAFPRPGHLTPCLQLLLQLQLMVGGGGELAIWWRMVQSTNQMLLSSGPWSPPLLGLQNGEGGGGGLMGGGVLLAWGAGPQNTSKGAYRCSDTPIPCQRRAVCQLLADFSGQFGGKYSAAEEKFSPFCTKSAKIRSQIWPASSHFILPLFIQVAEHSPLRLATLEESHGPGGQRWKHANPHSHRV